MLTAQTRAKVAEASANKHRRQLLAAIQSSEHHISRHGPELYNIKDGVKKFEKAVQGLAALLFREGQYSGIVNLYGVAHT